MELQNLTKELINFFRDNSSKKNDCEICGSSKLKEDLDLDSLDFVELVMKLEDEHCIKISDDDANKLQTIEDVACLIHKLKQK